LVIIIITNMVKEEEFIFKNKIYKIKIGQNKQDNWDLIDASNPNDIWFHTSVNVIIIPNVTLIRQICGGMLLHGIIMENT
jgi:hypothetical protein